VFAIAISQAVEVMSQERRRAKYSRYNASAKGKERIERYRATGGGIVARFRAEANQRVAHDTGRCEALGIDTSRPVSEQLDQIFADLWNDNQ
jgi:DnaJ-class molecular chaperone